MNLQHLNIPIRSGFGKLALVAVLALLLMGGTVSCNSDTPESDEQVGYTEPSDVAVKSFKLKADSKVLHGLDSVFFSIDLKEGVIYNADSLPVGTKVTDLIPVITYSSHITSAIINMVGGEKRTGDTDYLKHPNDSVDFTGQVTLKLTSSAGNYRTYRLKVNVHTAEPDTLCWGTSAFSPLPARLPSPLAQRTVGHAGHLVTLVQENDGTFTIARCSDPLQSAWQKNAAAFPFIPQIRSLSSDGQLLYILSQEGSLYSSADGNTWTATGLTWHSILGCYGSVLFGIGGTESDRTIESLGAKYPSVTLPDGFPIQEATPLYSYTSKWMDEPVGLIFGGVTARGEVTGNVWGFDGTRWACLAHEGIPPLRGAVTVPYLSYVKKAHTTNYVELQTLFLMGGMNPDGTLNHTVWVSYDNGVNWVVAPDMLQLPATLPATWQSDAAICYRDMSASLSDYWRQASAINLPPQYRIQTTVENDILSWRCPYIFLFGGKMADSTLQDKIWCGVLNRVLFTPII